MTNCIYFLLSFLLSDSPNKNDTYLELELKNIRTNLEKYDFKAGEIYIGDDTVKTNLIYFSKKQQMNNYLFCISKNANDSISVFMADSIKGYRIKEEYYLSRKMDDTHFFVKQLQTGKINLYQKVELPSDVRFLYFFTKNGKEWYGINPNEKTTKSTLFPNSSGKGMNSTFINMGVDKMFKDFFTKYTSDCLLIENSIKAGFYEITNIPLVVKSYNSCF